MLLVFLTLCLGACGTISREFDTAYRHSDAVAALPAGVQILALQAPQDLALAERVPAQPPSESHAILARSGGGANGAYGAGVITLRARRGVDALAAGSRIKRSLGVCLASRLEVAVSVLQGSNYGYLTTHPSSKAPSPRPALTP